MFTKFLIILIATTTAVVIYFFGFGSVMFNKPFNIKHFIIGFVPQIHFVIAVLKCLIIFSKRRKLFEIFRSTENDFIDAFQEKHEAIKITKSFSAYFNYSKLFYGVTIVSTFAFVFKRLVMRNYEFQFKVPFDIINRHVVIIVSMILQLAIAGVNLMTDVIIYGMIVNLSISFNILAYQFENLEKNVNLSRLNQLTNAASRFKIIKKNKTIKKCRQNQAKSSKEDKIIFQIEIDDLKPLITKHSQLLDCHKVLEKTFNPIFFVKFFQTTFLTCIVAFQLTITKNDSFFYISLLLRDFFYIFIMCYFCQMSKDTSLNVAEAIEKIKWNEIDDIDIKKALIMILLRSQEPATFKILKTFEISFEMFSDILSASYSYYSLCLHLYYDK